MTKEKKKVLRKQERSTEEIVSGVKAGIRSDLAQAITLVESNAARHFSKSQDILGQLMPDTGKSVRIGISGVPGAGKSTFIEAFGLFLCNQGKKVAVLAVDPSSSRTGGSILGDKTRMEQLARHPQAFIRPSPSSGTLGGVHRKTRESILLCEAAGFDVILVETVGVGQSEAIVRDMVDFFLLLVLTGAGDELQGMKKGIMELVDAILVNKADGENAAKAKKTAEEYRQILHFLQPATEGWETKAFTCSALYENGIDQTWETINEFLETTIASGEFDKRRNEQKKTWLYTSVKSQLEMMFFQNDEVKKQLPELEKEIQVDRISVSAAVNQLMEIYKKGQ
ncbi:methylmalonyl Co-A mutase-associated GTPase MeaB [Bacillus tianshenii]|uniref:methylmalonyl Co-A mutase-associated GTPase MeaB n=1 Tax=Sutcliffiella tianshenii TaxID=1463404 RepID=UPI001CD5C21C|nr:methylmalonyl Co-A mutase-associated GTPase MeaB [Bacillus tianshenii]MCA1320614.1 methylmalonyl Co-A mutase-associated GTPase MeaB [Bacillus tianshenii]